MVADISNATKMGTFLLRCDILFKNILTTSQFAKTMSLRILFLKDNHVMHVISRKKLREFWENPKYANSEIVLSAWHHVVEDATWENFADVRKTYSSADQVGNKTVFNVGGNKFRIVAFIDYEAGKVFIRSVLTHKECDAGNWANDEFGDDWKPFRKIVEDIKKRKGQSQ